MRGRAPGGLRDNLGCFWSSIHSRKITDHRDAQYWNYAYGTHRSLEQYRRGDLQTCIDSCLLHYKYWSLTELLMLRESNMLNINEWSDLLVCNLFTLLQYRHMQYNVLFTVDLLLYNGRWVYPVLGCKCKCYMVIAGSFGSRNSFFLSERYGLLIIAQEGTACWGKPFIIQNVPKPTVLGGSQINHAQVKWDENSAGGVMQKKRGGL